MSKSNKGGECVKVVIRCRPMNKKEINDGHQICVSMNTKNGIVEVKGGKDVDNVRRFTFDSVYDMNSKQQELYDETFKDLVQSVLEGFNGTIFAYGQTGTGKTHTMQGIKEDPVECGVIPRSFDHIFNHISRSTQAQYLVRASYLEIYKEDVRDLLHKDQHKRLEIKENPETGVYVQDLSSVLANSNKELFNVMHIGNKNRSVGATNMNEQSSRSHAIFIVTIECSLEDSSGDNHIRVGKLNMVDLAGSERQSKTQSEGERLKEATKINLSLSALGNVISALVDGKSSYVPYRDSKLTRMLQDSLGGNSKTVMVANIGPASYNFDETLNTLRYASRAKNIKNKPKINEDPKDALLREYQEKIERLKQMLGDKGGSGSTVSSGGKKKRRSHKRASGDGEESCSDDGEEGEINAREYHKLKMDELNHEKQAILADESIIQSQKVELLDRLKKEEKHLNEELTNKQDLESQIKAMESKVLRGDKDIAQHTRDQEADLEKRRREINEQKRKQKEIYQQMLIEQENLERVKEEKTSLQVEVERSNQRLKKLNFDINDMILELKDLEREHCREREDLESRQEQLTKENKLKELILEHFVASEEVKKIRGRLKMSSKSSVAPDQDRGDDADPCWTLQPLASTDGQNSLQQRPRSALGGRRPVAKFCREITNCFDNNSSALNVELSPRYRGENILILLPELPSRTTRDYEPPKMAPQLVAALETALQDEEGDLVLDGSKTRKKPTNRKLTNKRSTRSRKKTSNQSEEEEQFPTSKGLVSKYI